MTVTNELDNKLNEIKDEEQKELITYNSHEIIFYHDSSNEVRIEILLQNENLWLTQARIADLFGVDRSVITKHLKSIFDEEELSQDSVCANFAHTAADGKNYKTNFDRFLEETSTLEHTNKQ